MKRILAAVTVFAALTGMQAKPPTAAPLKLWRLDCGEVLFKQYGAFFSDTHQYPPGPKKLVDSCYLIQRGNEYLLWDTGLPGELKGNPVDLPQMGLSLRSTVVEQLAQLGIKPEQVGRVGISHWHFDHVGQAASFPNARLLIGKEDAAMLRQTPPPDKDAARALAHWLSGSGKIEEIGRDHDVFGDGSVTMLSTPGHTPGHHALLVRLPSGPVLLSGDQYHFIEQVKNRGVPPFNDNRADTLASMDRFDRIAGNLKAKVVIQHEPAHVAKLPAFPAAAE